MLGPDGFQFVVIIPIYWSEELGNCRDYLWGGMPVSAFGSGRTSPAATTPGR
jgi:hypothetical protein